MSEKQYPLNDDIGKVTYFNHMGSDLTVVNAARVSMDKEHTEFDNEKDEKLIRFLARNKHITPFFHPQVEFRIKMPFFVAREWYRHEVGFARNEVSRRYVTHEPEFFIPESWRGKPIDKKQGSSGEMKNSHEYCTIANDLAKEALENYNKMVEDGVAPELARTILPQNMYTEFIETGSLSAYARLVGLRDQPDAQEEIKLYAQAVSNVLKELFPISWKYLTEY